MAQQSDSNGDAFAFDIAENQGLGYATQHYCNGDNFEDPITRHLWNAAGSAQEALQAYLEKQTGREF